MRDTHEVWKNIKETQNKYSVSNRGRVRNNETGLLIGLTKGSKGYIGVSLNFGNGNLKFYTWCKDNGYKDGLFVRRYNTLEKYMPENCYIGDKLHHKAKYYNYNNKLYTINELAEISGYGTSTLSYRLKHGMTVKEAVESSKIYPGRPRKEQL